MPATPGACAIFVRMALCAGALAVVGCGGNESSAPRTASSTSSPLAKAEKLSTPVTEAEVEAFLDIAAKLPGGEFLEFRPASATSAPAESSGERTSPDDLVARWRTEFRAAYDPRRQAQLWRRDPRLREIFEQAGADPEAVARFLVRMSIALVRDAVASHVDLSVVARRVDLQIAALTDELRRAAQAPDAEPAEAASIVHVRDYALTVDALREATAFSEFVRLVQAAPDKSLPVVRNHRAKLARYSPPQNVVAEFERRSVTSAVVVPAAAEIRKPAAQD